MMDYSAKRLKDIEKVFLDSEYGTEGKYVDPEKYVPDGENVHFYGPVCIVELGENSFR